MPIQIHHFENVPHSSVVSRLTYLGKQLVQLTFQQKTVSVVLF